MRWFETREADAMPDNPHKVKFTSVSNPRVRAPSWLPQARGRTLRKEDTPSLRPPPLPVGADAGREEPVEGVGFDGLDQMEVEAGFARAAAVLGLAIAGHGDELEIFAAWSAPNRAGHVVP